MQDAFAVISSFCNEAFAVEGVTFGPETVQSRGRVSQSIFDLKSSTSF
ncbi:hypothetical protein LX87_01351 [Larkinella arboricola]|uniref:Uncharacterized protein n=1 Tax=Larkinella arboricola TaxID=643671 RepID=A0A327X934_LARAB|nr:hypothetical protein LX87_01351 [Larkinella arboricola]